MTLPAAKKPKKIKEIQEPTRQDVKAAMQWVSTHTNLVPTLWGPTASGKTYMVHEWAKELGGECVTVLLSQHTPDEIAGFQTEVGGELVAQMPYWWKQAEQLVEAGKPVVLLFDELGLAREEVRGAVYTFFRDRELHGHKLDADNIDTYRNMQVEIEAWLRRNNVPYYMPDVLPSHLYVDTSHPLSQGYAALAKQLFENDSFRSNILSINSNGTD